MREASLSGRGNLGCPVWDSYKTRGAEKDAVIFNTKGVWSYGTLYPGPWRKNTSKERDETSPGLMEMALQGAVRLSPRSKECTPSGVHPVAWVWKDLGARTSTVQSCKKPREPSGAGLDREKANLNRREAGDLGRG